MAVRANSDPRYYRRFLIMGVVAFGVALWFLYDGMIRYPNERDRILAHDKLQEEVKDPVVFRDRWHEFTRQKGWPTSVPAGEPKKDNEIMMQFVMAALAGVVALGLFVGPLLARGRWIESTDTGINSSWGESFNFDQVVALNKRKWRDKGIAKVTYDDGSRKRRFVIDDYKFDRYPTDDILRELEANIDPALITGGPPEAMTEEERPPTVDAAAEGTVRDS